MSIQVASSPRRAGPVCRSGIAVQAAFGQPQDGLRSKLVGGPRWRSKSCDSANMWFAKLSAMAAARCVAARWSPELCDLCIPRLSKEVRHGHALSSDASSTVGVPSSGTLSALGLKLRMGQTTAQGGQVCPCQWRRTGEPSRTWDTMAEMPSAISEINPSVTAMTTTWASANGQQLREGGWSRTAQRSPMDGQTLRFDSPHATRRIQRLSALAPIRRDSACPHEDDAQLIHGSRLCVGGSACARPRTTPRS